MILKNKEEQESWNQFVLDQQGDFLQSTYWSDFQQSLGRKVYPLKLPGVQTLLIKHQLPFGQSYFYSPRGPLLEKEGSWPSLRQEVITLTEKERVIFWRLEPQEKLTSAELKRIKDVQPSQSLLLDLDKPEEQLLQEMYSKTRYNIRLAHRKGVEVKESRQIDDFLRLIHQTAARDDFVIYPDSYYRKLLAQDAKFVKLYVAYYQGKPLAANLIIFFGPTAYYVHGASSNEQRNVMAPYQLHWEIITRAKKMGCRQYDWWGRSEEKWPGLTRFKKGFGGRSIDYPGTFDLIINPRWYFFYQLAKRFSKCSP